VTKSHGPLFIKPTRPLLVFWAALAFLNLLAAVVLAEDPERAYDLDSMMRWGHAWLVDGLNVYQPTESVTDYPPNAIVLLSPLSLLPHSVAVPLWAAVNLVLALLAPYLAARFYRPFAPFRIILLPILMFLCWGGNRTLLQFTLVSLTLAMAALFFADRRPLMSGVCLGLALMKPQVAVPVLLWTLFTRRSRIACTAAGVVAIAFAIFCIRADAGPIEVVTRWIQILAEFHTDGSVFFGLSELRPLLMAMAPTGSNVDRVNGAIVIGLLAGICLAGFQEARIRTRLLYAAPPLAACWVLLAVRHLTYGFVVLLPVLMVLTLSGTERSRLRIAMFWLLQLSLMFDIPGLAYRAGLQGTPLYDGVLIHADRVLLIALFAGLVALAWKEPPLPDNLSGSDQVVG
jgi:glycosyl transferase family 87